MCVSSACTGLCGGQRVTAVPTATGFAICPAWPGLREHPSGSFKKDISFPDNCNSLLACSS